MPTKDNLYANKEARDKLISGIRKAADAIGATMGTGGSNILIEAMEYPGHIQTNDGATALAAMRFEDPIEEMGRRILLEAVSRANKLNGDGSSTTAVLTASILEEGIKMLDKASPMELKYSLERCVPLIEESINNQKREIEVSEVGAVAAISAEDEEIGARIQEIYEQIGREGIIHWDISKTPEDSYKIGQGITIDQATYVSPYMCDAMENGQSTNQIRIRNPKILLIKQKLSSAREFESIVPRLYEDGDRELVVFCDEFEPLMINDLILTRANRGFRVVLVKMPVLWKDWWYEDLAKATGAKIVDIGAGLAIKDVNIGHLGTVNNILVSKEATYLDGLKDISDYIQYLGEDGSDESKIRIARLNTKTARYYVGAQSDSALSYRRLKVEDAISAAYHALNGGIVAGGGIALLNCGRELDNSILQEALTAPFVQIYKNATGHTPYESESEKHIYGGTVGFNSKTREVEQDMFKAQITDPAVIVLNAVKNAISVAAATLTTNTVITLPKG